MKVVRSNEYVFVSADNGKYLFKDSYGSLLVTDECKYIDVENGNVLFMKPFENREPRIEYSYSTLSRIKAGLSPKSKLVL